MRTIAIGSVFFAAFAGCGQSSKVAPPPTGHPVQSGPEPSAATNVTRIESRLSAAELPKTPEALKEEFVRRFNEDNAGAFRDLCYWEDVPEDVKRKNMEIFMIGIGKNKHQVTSASIEPCSPNEFQTHFNNVDFPAVPNLSPTHALKVETFWKGEVDGLEEESDTNGRYPVGIKDGAYYLCVGVLPQ